LDYSDLKDYYTGKALGRLVRQNVTKRPMDELIAEAEKEGAIEAEEAYQRDKAFYRIAVALLGIAGLAVITGSTYLFAIGEDPSDGLIAIGSAAIGGLVGIFNKGK
jgi:hypothetical protein